MSSDSTLIKMFQDDNGTDIYKQMSSTIKGKVFGEVTWAKITNEINFDVRFFIFCHLTLSKEY